MAIPLEDDHSSSSSYQLIEPESGSEEYKKSSVQYIYRALGKVGITRKRLNQIYQLYIYDWVHSFLNAPTHRLVLLLMAIHFFTWFLFGVFYYLCPLHCEIPVETFANSFFFSIQTQTTIGFAAKDIYFGDCTYALIIILAQSITGMLLESLAVGLLYMRLSRGQTRASSILFSEPAVIVRHNGHYYFMFQVAELRTHQLVEAHVRCYAFTNASEEQEIRKGIQCNMKHRMRLQFPDDELGGQLFLLFPTLVVHRLDTWSPLVPLSRRVSATLGRGDNIKKAHHAKTSFLWPELLQRAADSDGGSRSSQVCLTCGEPFFFADQLIKHMRYSHLDVATTTVKHPTPAMNSSSSSSSSIPSLPPQKLSCCNTCGRTRHHSLSDNNTITSNIETELSNDEIREYLRSSRLEVVVIVEGIDPPTSNSIQIRHSYTIDDIVFDQYFDPCVYRDQSNVDPSEMIFDISKFHSTHCL